MSTEIKYETSELKEKHFHSKTCKVFIIIYMMDVS